MQNTGCPVCPQVGQELKSLLPQSPEYIDCRCTLLYLALLSAASLLDLRGCVSFIDAANYGLETI